MYPLNYYETFMRYEASDEVFVAMPFTGDFGRAYDTVIKPAIETVSINGKNLRPRIINRGTTGSPDIHEQIFEAIIHSRMVIADMTVQSNYTDNDGATRWQANANVAYEVGLATTWRNPEDILLIHQKHQEHSYSFDIQNLRHVPYETGSSDSVRLIADQIEGAIKQSTFLANRTYSKILQSLSPNAIQYMHIESRRAFPIIAFKKDTTDGLAGYSVHAVAELLSCGALINRNVKPQGQGKGVAVIYEWTKLGLRMLLSIGAINLDRQKKLTDQIASVPKDTIPPKELRDFPKSEIIPGETKVEAPQEVKKKE